jgi:hypothetical protein
LKITGSVDALFINDDGTFTICDWKRTKRIDIESYQEKKISCPFDNLMDCNYIKYSLQLNLYRVILEKFYNFEIRDMFLIVCHPKNENYIKLNVDRMEDEGELLLCMRKHELIQKGYAIDFEFDEKIEKKILSLIENPKMCNYDDIENPEELVIKPLLLKKNNPVKKTETVPLVIVKPDDPQPLFNKGKKWTEEDDDKLLKLNSDLYDYDDISKLLGRTENSIRLRILLKADYEFNNTSKSIDYICDEFKIKKEDLMSFRNDKEKEKIERERLKKIKEEQKGGNSFEKTINELKYVKEPKKPEIMSEKQQLAFDLFNKGENVFITSPAGCGKTHLIKKICSHHQYSNIGITSTTGTSAILINGTTLHSFLGIGLGDM